MSVLALASPVVLELFLALLVFLALLFFFLGWLVFFDFFLWEWLFELVPPVSSEELWAQTVPPAKKTSVKRIVRNFFMPRPPFPSSAVLPDSGFPSRHRTTATGCEGNARPAWPGPSL